MKNPLKIILGVCIGIIVAAGISYYVFDELYNREIASITLLHNEEMRKVQAEKNVLVFSLDSVNVVLEKYKVLTDSFMIVDEFHQVEIDHLNTALLEALDAVLEALPDVNYDFLQTRYLTNDTLQYAFSGEQVNKIAVDVVQSDYNDSLVLEYMGIENLLRSQMSVRDEVITTLSKDRHELALLAQNLYDRIAVLNKSNSMKEEKIAKLKKANRMWKSGTLGAGAFVVLVLLLL